MSYCPPVLKIWEEVEKTHSWKFIYQLFHRFFYCYKKMSLNKKGYYRALHTDLILEFYHDKRIMYSPTWTLKDYLKWFKNWLDNYDDIKLTEKDIEELNRITTILMFEK